jgi:hypothetical protein
MDNKLKDESDKIGMGYIWHNPQAVMLEQYRHYSTRGIMISNDRLLSQIKGKRAL